MLSCQDGGAGGSAGGCAGVGVGEVDAIPCNAVKVGCLDGRVAGIGVVYPLLVVGQDEQKIGTLSRRRQELLAEDKGYDCQTA